MEFSVPFFNFLKEISTHYKRSGTVKHTLTQSKNDETKEENNLKRKKQSQSAEHTNLSSQSFPIKCCGYYFRSASRFKTHLESKSHKLGLPPRKQSAENPPFKCCGYNFYHRSKLELHRASNAHKIGKLSKAPFKPIECCGVVINSVYSYRDHKMKCKLMGQQESKDSFQESCCGFTFNSYTSLKNHQKSLFHQRHQETIMPNGNKSRILQLASQALECCGTIFSSPCNLRCHKKSMTHQLNESHKFAKVGLKEERCEQKEKASSETHLQQLEGHVSAISKPPDLIKVEESSHLESLNEDVEANQDCKGEIDIDKKTILRKCARCSKMLTDVNEFLEHRAPIICCGLPYYSPAHLLRHRRRPIHYTKFHCIKCGDAFDEEEQLSVHQKDCHVSGRRHIFCNMEENTVNEQDPAVQKCLDTNVLVKEKSSRNTERSSTKTSLVTESQNVTEGEESEVLFKEVECCGKIFKCSSILRRHLATPSHQKIECGICNQCFNSEQQFNLHREKHHEEYSGRWICMICNKSFNRKDALSHHISVAHLREKRYECSKCPFVSSLKRTLKKHNLYVHEGFSEKLYCDSCKREFQTKTALISHISSVHDKKELQCSICPRTFVLLNALRDHEKNHSKKFPCQVCGKVFLNYHTRERHFKIHFRVNAKKTNQKKPQQQSKLRSLITKYQYGRSHNISKTKKSLKDSVLTARHISSSLHPKKPLNETSTQLDIIFRKNEERESPNSDLGLSHKTSNQELQRNENDFETKTIINVTPRETSVRELADLDDSSLDIDVKIPTFVNSFESKSSHGLSLNENRGEDEKPTIKKEFYNQTLNQEIHESPKAPEFANVFLPECTITYNNCGEIVEGKIEEPENVSSMCGTAVETSKQKILPTSKRRKITGVPVDNKFCDKTSFGEDPKMQSECGVPENAVVLTENLNRIVTHKIAKGRNVKKGICKQPNGKRVNKRIVKAAPQDTKVNSPFDVLLSVPEVKGQNTYNQHIEENNIFLVPEFVEEDFENHDVFKDEMMMQKVLSLDEFLFDCPSNANENRNAVSDSEKSCLTPLVPVPPLTEWLS